MANDPEEKQPPDSPAEDKTSAAAPAHPPEEDLPPDLEWNVRAHPVVQKKHSPAAPAPPAKPDVPAAAAPPGPSAGDKPSTPSPPPAGDELKKPTPPAVAPVAPSGVPPKPAAPTEAASAEGEAKPAAPAAPAKPAAPAGTAPPKPPGPPPPPKEAPPKPVPFENELVKRFRVRFGDSIREAWLDRKQAILVVDCERLAEIARYARDDEKFDFLSDLTAVDWPKREKRFDIILNLYSFPKNERLRLKAHAAENEPVPSVAGVWSAANWLEREAFDMFGMKFAGHPDLRRILLPEEWQGHPLRKDYDILTQDTAWVRENLGIESGQ